MNVGNLVIINNFLGLEHYAASICLKENFSINEEKMLLIALKEDINNVFSIYKMIDFPSEMNELKKLGTFDSYFQRNRKEKFYIKELALSYGISLSWLQVVQVNELNKYHNNTKENIDRINQCYQRVFKEIT